MRKILRSILIFSFFPTVNSYLANGQTTRQIENLKAFSKAYGYVKYFHPSDEVDQIDWGLFASYGVQQIINCNDSDELLDSLNKLFQPFAPTVIFSNTPIEKSILIKSITPNSTKDYSEIYWQHYGVGKDMINPSKLYQSVRVNKLSIKKNDQEFGGLGRSIETKEFRGMKFKFTGFANLSKESQGTGHFWVRDDTEIQGLGFFNNMDDNPIKPSGWKQYEIEGKLSDFSERLVYGAFLKGNGTLSIDDIRLFVFDKENWVEIPLKNNGFENGNWKDEGWGPIGMESNIFNGTENKNAGEYSLVIEREVEDALEKQKPLFKGAPSIKEPWIRELTPGLWINMPMVLYSNEEHSFPIGIHDMEAYKQSIVRDSPKSAAVLEFRLGNIINTWNVFQHFYPYFEEVQIDWDKALEEHITFAFSSNESTHIEDLETITSSLRDGHIRVTGPSTSYFAPLIDWEWIEDKLIITKVLDENLGIKPGNIVESIEGLNPVEFFEKIRNKISAPTKGWLDYRANIQSLMGKEGSIFEIGINGKNHHLIREASYYERRALEKSKEPPFKLLDEGIVYINLDIASMDTINSIMPILEESSAIIADLRGYPKGNNRMLINHFLKKSDNRDWMQVDKIIYPDRADKLGYNSFGWKMSPQKPFLGDKKVVFITDGQAISYAESYLGFIEGNSLATIIGQPSAGTNGNINSFSLPGGYVISFTGMHVVKHDGSQHHGIGILPDIYVKKTIEGIRVGRDEFLERAVEVVKN